MPQVRNEDLSQLIQMKKYVADLCRETNIEYKRLSGILHGYWNARPEEDRAIRKAFSNWKGQTNDSK